ncbi:uncharacterized protein LY89DRAFT_170043 [Mollisia scopiformis]|uniref:Uncharacterized protein n=1 Tax=Mollisia scopiformis TaxID=149040 RepID=A0A194XSJ9_MOLSC|nr:uncharacterized protein LY89DRAFT_170043 [Mollisia scopiformis]KUJ23173.1 hypothetical protein LY89DRAFT_170043 [Mollisia scopiformis]
MADNNSEMGSLPPPELPIEGTSTEKAPTNPKRPFQEQTPAGDDEVDDPDFVGPQSAHPAKKKVRKYRLLDDAFTYIGTHVKEPLVEVLARIGKDGKIWTRAVQKGDSRQLSNWSDLVSSNGRVKFENIKIDSRVIGDFAGLIDETYLDERVKLVKDFLNSDKSRTTTSRERVELPPPPPPPPPPVYEPSRIQVGTDRVSKQPVSAIMIHGKGDHGPYVRFSRVGLHVGYEYKDIEFDQEYWRGSINASKKYIKTLFKVKDDSRQGSQSQRRELEEVDDASEQSSDDEVEQPIQDGLGTLKPSNLVLSDGFEDAFASLDKSYNASIDRLRREAGRQDSVIGEREGEIEGLRSDIEELSNANSKHQETIAEHELTIRTHDAVIEELSLARQQEAETSSALLRQRNEIISNLEARVKELTLGGGSNSGHTAKTDNEAALKSQVKELEAKLKAAESANMTQAWKIASFSGESEDSKNTIALRLQHEVDIRDDKIAGLEQELQDLRAENGQSQFPHPLLPLPIFTREFDLHGLRFEDGFVKVPEAFAKASLFKERNGAKFTGENNILWQKTRMLQDNIIVAGTPLDRIETIAGARYACYEEGGKQKRLRLPDQTSLVLYDQKYCIEWEILKETDPEEVDYSF